ncbi:MAG: hypothetical protein F4149_15755 [Gammaproteobacteria bacterium]|nr:hypothetical protein [Gammaproteobacteria bacterium]MYK81875.1 hypothetical protein [Gammaproteobacteria bacterium]
MGGSPTRGGAGFLPLCFAVQLLLAGCGTGVLGDGIEQLDDLDEVPSWFEQHREELEVVMRLLLPHANVHRVRHSKPSYADQNGRFSPADEAAYAGAFAIKQRLGISEVIVWRRGGKSPAFDFVLWRIGIAVSGRSTSLRYNEERDEKKTILANWGSPPNQALYLGEPGWFAIRSSSD